MGRRALRKIDPSLDLSRHLMAFDQLPRPWKAAAIFGRAAPLEVEVGTGKGLFLRNASAGSPDIDFLGIEIVHKYARFAAAGLVKTGTSNARVVSGDALRVFAELIPDAALAAVHVYFPDPWWKKRHRKRRVMNETFVGHVERALVPGGTLHFWTDVEEYYQVTLELLAATTRLDGPIPVLETGDCPDSCGAPAVRGSENGTVPVAPGDLAFRTHFERRMRLNNEPVYRAEFRKRS
jgi:tRNA (guanine-N7-)-methyltransferase